jgi:uncharacterized protein YbaA (DUF1428 family)
MTYIEGFVVPVPSSNRDAFREHAEQMAGMVQGFGIARQVEAWASDVPHGKATDFYRAVDAQEDETVVFAWFEYPSKAARDAANEKFRADPRMEELPPPPFDGKRMILGGFEAIVEQGSATGSYVDGFVVPVPQGKRDSYRELAEKMGKVFREKGATRVLEAFSDDVSRGQVTDYYRAVNAEEGEGVVFSFIEWPNKATRDQAWKAIMEDESHRPQGDMPFDGKRMFWGGFDVIIDTQPAKAAETVSA